MILNRNHDHQDEINRDDMVLLKSAIQSIRNDEPRDAQWQEARRNLLQAIQSQKQESFIMRMIQKVQPKKLRWNFSIPVYATGVVALFIVVFLAVNMIDNRSNLAFSQVLEQIRSVQVFSFKSIVEQENLPPMEFETIYMEPSRQRVTAKDGGIQIMDMKEGKSLSLDPKNKKAYLLDMSNLPRTQSQPNFIDSMRQLQAGSEEFLGIKSFDGVIASGYHVKRDGQDIVIWADKQTGLPVRVEQKWAMYGNMNVIMTDFNFDPPVDESLFSLTPPEGYEVMSLPTVDVSVPVEQDLIEALRMVTGYSQGKFPKALTLDAMAKMLQGKIGKGEPTEEEVKEFSMQFAKLTRGLLFAQQNNGNDWHYEPEGVQLGDTKPLCWWKPQGSVTYRVIYGNLEIADVHPRDFTQE